MKAKILVVDDERDILQLLKHRLIQWGFEVVLAQNPYEFERAAVEEKPDLIILDIMLGEVDATRIYDMLIRRKRIESKVPIVFLSALASDRPLSRAQPGRTFALHSKPFEPEDLLRDIHCLLGFSTETTEALS